MNGPDTLDRIAAGHAALAPALAGGPDWANRRRRSLATIVARGLPGRRDENWKYLDHTRIAQYPMDVVPRAAAGAAEIAARLLPIAGARRIVLVDGRFERGLSDAHDVPGIEVLDLGLLLESDPAAALALLRRPDDDADDRYALLADAFTANGVVIRLAPGARPAAPLYLVNVGTAAEAGAYQARIAIEIGAGAKLTLVEHYFSLGSGAALGNFAGEVAVDDDAEVIHLRLHEHGPAAALIETWSTRLAADSRYEQHFVATGGRLLRSGLRLGLCGRGASCRLAALFLADGDRQVDLHTRVEHHAATTETQQECRGIAADRGRGAFNGVIVVHPAARGANASQASRNLLLSPLAEINARPQLEIHVDEVQCRHGATTGTLDEDQLFYLRSRGLDAAAARALLTWAFCQDILGRLPLPEVRAAAERLVAGALPDRDLIRGIA